MLKTSDVAKEREIIGLQTLPIAYQCFDTPILTMIQSISVPFWSKQVFQHSRCLPALCELALLCQEQGSLPERQTVGLDYANTPHSHNWLVVLEAWTHADLHWCDCSHLVITAVTLITSHTDVPPFQPQRGQTRVLWYTWQIKWLKKSWKSVFLFLGYSGASGPFKAHHFQ